MLPMMVRNLKMILLLGYISSGVVEQMEHLGNFISGPVVFIIFFLIYRFNILPLFAIGTSFFLYQHS